MKKYFNIKLLLTKSCHHAVCKLRNTILMLYLMAGILQGVHFGPDVLQVWFRRFGLQNYFVHRNCKIDDINQPGPRGHGLDSPLLFDSLEDGGVKRVKGGRGTERLLNINFPIKLQPKLHIFREEKPWKFPFIQRVEFPWGATEN